MVGYRAHSLRWEAIQGTVRVYDRFVIIWSKAVLLDNSSSRTLYVLPEY